MQASKNISFETEDRQWDGRFNVQLDEDLGRLVEHIKADVANNKLVYVLIGGVEIGEVTYRDDYEMRHVHVAAIFKDKISKNAILNNWGVKRGNGYYLVPRNRGLPFAGWRAHHTKEHTKVDKSRCVLYEHGTLPADKGETPEYQKRSDEEKKRKLDEILVDMKDMMENGQEDECFRKWPRTTLQYGEKIKAMIHQKKDRLTATGDPHIWVHGPPGQGKSTLLSYIYPNTYKKNLYNRFFDLYDDKIHDHILLEDLDHDAVDKLSTNFLKTLCDETGFPVDQKYKTPKPSRSVILVTSNFTIPDVINNSTEANVFGKSQNTQAMLRRFWHIDVRELLRLLKIKQKTAYEINMLKKAGNTDESKLFMAWDWTTDTPLCEPIKSPQEYQSMIKQIYYG